jgi:hypothetical protein
MKIDLKTLIYYVIQYFAARIVFYIVGFYAFYYGQIQTVVNGEMAVDIFLKNLWGYVFAIFFAEGSIFVLKQYK